MECEWIILSFCSGFAEAQSGEKSNKWRVRFFPMGLRDRHARVRYLRRDLCSTITGNPPRSYRCNAPGNRSLAGRSRQCSPTCRFRCEAIYPRSARGNTSPARFLCSSKEKGALNIQSCLDMVESKVPTHSFPAKRMLTASLCI